MRGLETLFRKVEEAKIKAEVWINGSFLTFKENPNDSDIVLFVDSTVVDFGTARQKEVLNWVQSDLRKDYLCDSHMWALYITGDRFSRDLNELGRKTWFQVYGFSRAREQKGIAVVTIGVRS